MRRIKRRSAEKSIAVIIDGKDEKWYLETIKEHYPNMAMKKATIKPDLPQKKKRRGTVCFGTTETCYGIHSGYPHLGHGQHHQGSSGI